MALSCAPSKPQGGGSGASNEDLDQVRRNPALPPGFVDAAHPILIAKILDPQCVNPGCVRDVLDVVPDQILRFGEQCGRFTMPMPDEDLSLVRSAAAKFAAEGEDRFLIVPGRVEGAPGACTFVGEFYESEVVNGGVLQSDLSFGFVHWSRVDNMWIVVSVAATQLARQVDEGLIDLPPSGKFGDFFQLGSYSTAPLDQMLQEIAASNTRVGL